jgi:hypothetical protein
MGFNGRSSKAQATRVAEIQRHLPGGKKRRLQYLEKFRDQIHADSLCTPTHTVTLEFHLVGHLCRSVGEPA